MKDLCSSYDELPVVLSISQAAAILGISRSRALALMRAGDIPSMWIGERMFVPREALLMWIDPAAGADESYCEEQ